VSDDLTYSGRYGVPAATITPPTKGAARIANVSRPRAYSYLRFSTPEQEQGDSQRRQTALARAYADQHGLDLDTGLTFQDLGVSAYHGANAGAGRLGDFLEAVRTGVIAPGSWLLVESLDRVSRMVPRKAARVLEDIVDAGVTVVTLGDGRRYTAEVLNDDAITYLVAILTFVRANEESKTKALRVGAAWENKKRTAAPGDDRPYTRRTPGWLRWFDDEKAFLLIPERAAVVRRVFEETARGRGQHAIAEALNLEGVAPFSGKAHGWHRSYVKKLLDNPAVIGTLVPHSTTHEGAGKATGKRRVPWAGARRSSDTSPQRSRRRCGRRSRRPVAVVQGSLPSAADRSPSTSLPGSPAARNAAAPLPASPRALGGALGSPGWYAPLPSAGWGVPTGR